MYQKTTLLLSFVCLLSLIGVPLEAEAQRPRRATRASAPKQQEGAQRPRRSTKASSQKQQEGATWIMIREVSSRDARRVARHPELTKEKFQSLIQKPNTRVITEQNLRDSLVQHRRKTSNVSAGLKRMYRTQPETLSRIELTAKRPTGRRARSRSEVFETLNAATLENDLYRTAQLARDPKAQAYLHQQLYEMARQQARRTRSSTAELARVSPSRIRGATVEKTREAIGDLIGILHGLLDPPVLSDPPPGYPDSCDEEEGSGLGSDRTGNSGDGFDEDGIYANYDWPLKYYNTCVKNQRGKRGTCSAFSFCAAVESAIAVKHGRWVNLSEQDLYKHQRLEWSPNPVDYLYEEYGGAGGDGYSPLMSFLGQILSGYVFPFEESWNYNPSLNRDWDQATHTFSNSCDDYTEDCSDTAHQAKLIECYTAHKEVLEEVVETVSVWVEGPVDGATQVVNAIGNAFGVEGAGEWVEQEVTKFVTKQIPYEVCVYSTEIPGTSGFRVTSAIELWNPFDRQNAISLAKVYLDALNPICYCFVVPDTYRNPDGGFVSYDADEEGSGGHCVLLTGYVDNEDLPAGIAAGSGGGYFIIKNSYGTGKGDMGYYYLPYDWVEQWTTSMVAVTGIAP